MEPGSQAWDRIYRREGRVPVEPFARFPELVDVFRERGCSRILDLGCGSGRHVVHLAKDGFQVFGLDVSPTGAGLTREWLVAEGLAAGVVVADMRESLPFRDGAFEGLMSTQVIHHAQVSSIQRTIGEIRRVLRAGGLAFVTVSAQKEAGIEFEEIEPGTFVPLTGPEAGLPHHIFSEEELVKRLEEFVVLDVSLRAEGKVLAVLALKP
jgi:SAM-dependent methyltransferase